MSNEIIAVNDDEDVVDDTQVNELLSMSDEDIDKMVQPPVSGSNKEVVEPKQEEEPVKEEVKTEDVEDESNSDPANTDDTGSDKKESKKPEKTESKQDDKTEQEKSEVDPEKKEPSQEEESINYEESYKKIMAPFKANGKEIKLNSPEEVVKLMQMGANYTRKMQALQPHLKMVKMLENNNLLDTDKLSYLIDLNNKNPQAINKLIKESGIDPLDIDSESKEEYRPTNHTVSDQEVNFSQTVDELIQDNVGKEVLLEVKTQWDAVSKQEILKEPETLRHLVSHKQNGIYDKITTEMEKQKLLGNLQNVPFIHAYVQVGQYLEQNGLLKPTSANTEQQIVDTRVKAPAKQVSNSDKAKAAAPLKTTPAKSVREEFNPLALSDDEFLKSDLAKTL